jgi:hypothetical protein
MAALCAFDARDRERRADREHDAGFDAHARHAGQSLANAVTAVSQRPG